MPNSARIVLAFILLACPYICLGERVSGALCPHRDCDERCHTVPQDAPTAESSRCDGCVHAVQTVPDGRPSKEHRCPSPCLCQGALASVEFRLPDVDLAHNAATAELLLTVAADAQLPAFCEAALATSPKPVSGRALSLRVCALLI